MARQTKRGVAARLFRSSGTALAVLAAASFAAAPVSANVGSELNNFFDDMGAAANATGPVAYQGQSAGYYSGGNIWTRFPQKNVNPVNLQLPGVKAGCGGIDVFSGSFSFINTDEIVAMLKATANNALGFDRAAIEAQLAQLAHSVKDLNGRAYNRTEFVEQRRTVLQAWANYLDTLRQGNVLPLRAHSG